MYIMSNTKKSISAGNPGFPLYAMIDSSKQALIYNKCLLLPDRSLTDRQFHIFSDSQDIGALCLEMRYRSDVLQSDQKTENDIEKTIHNIKKKQTQIFTHLFQICPADSDGVKQCLFRPI